MVLLGTPPLSLYIHLPWCVRKCPYCDFNSHVAAAAAPDGLQTRYIDALLTDLEQQLPRVWGRHVDSVFIGGGTPSLFSGDALARLLSAVRARLPLRPGAEITLEANPGTFERDRFAAFRDAGVTRLSLGVQSFDDALLTRLGRIHDGDDARRALDAAHGCGFEHVNVDLMFALPTQTVAQARADLEQAIAFAPDHVSYYQLTLEPNTVFYKRPPPLPDDDTAWDMQQQGQRLLAAAGYRQYEVSAYARDGGRCRHNLNYWQFGDYLGIGAGAHGKLTLPAEQRIERTLRLKHPDAYLAAPSRYGERRPLDTDALPFEFMLNALRLCDGVPARLFVERTGLPLQTVRAPLALARQRGLLQPELQTLCPTRLGQRFLNDLIALFLADTAASGGLSNRA